MDDLQSSLKMDDPPPLPSGYPANMSQNEFLTTHPADMPRDEQMSHALSGLDFQGMSMPSFSKLSIREEEKRKREELFNFNTERTLDEALSQMKRDEEENRRLEDAQARAARVERRKVKKELFLREKQLKEKLKDELREVNGRLDVARGQLEVRGELESLQSTGNLLDQMEDVPTSAAQMHAERQKQMQVAKTSRQARYDDQEETVVALGEYPEGHRFHGLTTKQIRRAKHLELVERQRLENPEKAKEKERKKLNQKMRRRRQRELEEGREHGWYEEKAERAKLAAEEKRHGPKQLVQPEQSQTARKKAARRLRREEEFQWVDVILEERGVEFKDQGLIHNFINTHQILVKDRTLSSEPLEVDPQVVLDAFNTFKTEYHNQAFVNSPHKPYQIPLPTITTPTAPKKIPGRLSRRHGRTNPKSNPKSNVSPGRELTGSNAIAVSSGKVQQQGMDTDLPPSSSRQLLAKYQPLVDADGKEVFAEYSEAQGDIKQEMDVDMGG